MEGGPAPSPAGYSNTVIGGEMVRTFDGRRSLTKYSTVQDDVDEYTHRRNDDDF